MPKEHSKLENTRMASTRAAVSDAEWLCQPWEDVAIKTY